MQDVSGLLPVFVVDKGLPLAVINGRLVVVVGIRVSKVLACEVPVKFQKVDKVLRDRHSRTAQSSTHTRHFGLIALYMLPAETARLENVIGRRLTLIQVSRVEAREGRRTSWGVGSCLDLVNVAVDVATLQHQ